MTEELLDLGTYAIGDKFPYPYFIFIEDEFDITNRKFNAVDLVPANYTAIKFCARSEKNNSNVDDHALDDIYTNLTPVSGPVYRYQWATDDIDKIGRWIVRLEFEKTGGEKFHSPWTWYFYVTHKMEGKFGDH